MRSSFQELRLSVVGLFALCACVTVTEAAVPLWQTRVQERDGQFALYGYRSQGGIVGLPVDAADYDGDGVVDLAMAPMAANTGPGESRSRAGEVYVYRGQGTFGARVDRAEFTDETFPGLTIMAPRHRDLLGVELFSADINGDAIVDLIIGAQNYDGPNRDRPDCGAAFVLLGGEGILDDGSVVDLNFEPATPPPGWVVIIGERCGDRLGMWVEAGDADGDGIADLLLGGDQSFGPTVADENLWTGMAAVVYGRTDFPSIMDLADGPETLEDVAIIYGRDRLDHFGCTLHGADLDGDGADEILIAAALNRASASFSDDLPGTGQGGGDGPPGSGRIDAGETVILFSDGNTRLSGRIDLGSELPPELSGRITTIYGATPDDACGEEIASGDFDGDGKLELILGALTALNEFDHVEAGAAYIFDGAEHLRGRDLDLADLDNAPEGLSVSTFLGHEVGMIFGDTIITGDYDRDGFDDVALSAPGWLNKTGEVLILYGGQTLPTYLPYILRNDLTNTLRRTLIRGPDVEDAFGYSLDSADWNGDGHADLVINSMRADGFNNRFPGQNVGECYVVDGRHLAGFEFSLRSIAPDRTAPETPIEVTLEGNGFEPAEEMRVLVGGIEATNVQVLDESTITATFPTSLIAGVVDVAISSGTRHAALGEAFFYENSESFVRGDVDGNLVIDITDPILSLTYLLLGGPTTCLDAHDTNDNGVVEIADSLLTLTFFFLDIDSPPEPPHPSPGPDPTRDDFLGCP